MAVIGKIRSYSGLLIAVIGFALAAFVLGDFLGYGPGARQTPVVGKVDRTSITFQEFERRVSERLENYRAETGQQMVSPSDAFQIRQQVWNEFLREALLEREYERLGLQVTREELYDMIHGPEPHQLIVRSFTNPEDGSFDRQSVANFFRNFDQFEPAIRAQWANLERFMKSERLESKYHTLISRGYHVPTLFAEKDFRARNTTADLRFVYKPFVDIADSLVRVSDRDLRRVYDENKERFRQEATRNISFVSFSVFASDADRQALQQELVDLKEEFATAEDVASFVNAVSDRRFDPTFYAPGSLSPEIDPLFFDAEPGTMHGPYLDGNSYVLAMLADVQMRPDSMRASHILLSYAGAMGATPQTMRSPGRAQELADSLLDVVQRNPARFAALAAEFSDDPSAQFNQGDLEWFPDGAMVPGFNQAVIDTRVGGFTTAESEFGFHVIHVTGKSPATKKIQVARLTRDIEPSGRTYQGVYARVSEFASLARQSKGFEEAAQSLDVPVREARGVQAMDFSVPGIDNPRPVVQWAFMDETRVGSVSRIFELENTFIVATVTEAINEGIPTLEQVRDQVMAMAMRDKKFELLANQIAQEGGGTLDAIAASLQREVVEAPDVRFSSTTLPTAGSEPAVIGTAFTLEENALSAPIKGNNGVFVVQLQSISPGIVPDDLSTNKRTLQNNFANRVPAESFNAVRNEARIEDNRHMFY